MLETGTHGALLRTYTSPVCRFRMSATAWSVCATCLYPPPSTDMDTLYLTTAQGAAQF